ncbi:MAG TPA: ECF-type sigma factor [Longimicrobiales bacterium]|nr:ECF-type sigma factor [Longimicrobiales bacterium]
MPDPTVDITQLLQRWSGGDEEALQLALPTLYERLRELAHQRRSHAPGDHSLNTTALVHEAYLRLAAGSGATLRDRCHFLAVASRVMRNVLVDHARARYAAKRGGGAPVVELHEDVWISGVDTDRVMELDAALARLESVDSRQSRIIEQHYFGGMSIDEIAAALDLSPRTVKRQLRSARAWLAMELRYDA